MLTNMQNLLLVCGPLQINLRSRSNLSQTHIGCSRIAQIFEDYMMK